MDGNLKSVMRIILALAAHFKPSAKHRAAPGSRGTSSHNPLSPVALAQGAAAALASARHDASQPARAACLPRYARLRAQTQDKKIASVVLRGGNVTVTEAKEILKDKNSKEVNT